MANAEATQIKPLYVNQVEAAAMLSTSPQQILNMEKRRGFPKPTRDGGFVRYSVAEIEAWMTERKG